MAMKCSSAAGNINPALQNYLAALVYIVDSGKGKARTGKKWGGGETLGCRVFSVQELR